MLENVISAATKKSHKLWLEIIAFEEGECLPFVYCTRVFCTLYLFLWIQARSAKIDHI